MIDISWMLGWVFPVFVIASVIWATILLIQAKNDIDRTRRSGEALDRRRAEIALAASNAVEEAERRKSAEILKMRSTTWVESSGNTGIYITAGGVRNVAIGGRNVVQIVTGDGNISAGGDMMNVAIGTGDVVQIVGKTGPAFRPPTEISDAVEAKVPRRPRPLDGKTGTTPLPFPSYAAPAGQSVTPNPHKPFAYTGDGQGATRGGREGPGGKFSRDENFPPVECSNGSREDETPPPDRGDDDDDGGD